MSRFSCPGLVKVNEPGRVWFVPKGCTMMGATYCQECFVKLVKTHQIDRADFTEIAQTAAVGECNCDYEPNSLIQNGVRISVCDADIKTTLVRFPLLLNVEAQKAGVIHPILPTGANFKIVFENLHVKEADKFGRYTEPNHDLVHLTLESGKCGEEKIMVKDQDGNSNLVYVDKIIVDSFESGTTKSFQFIAEEKQGLGQGKEKKETKKNVFTFEIGRYTKVCKLKPMVSTWRTRGLGQGGQSDRDVGSRWGDGMSVPWEQPRFGDGGRYGRDSGADQERRPLNLRRGPRASDPFAQNDQDFWSRSLSGSAAASSSTARAAAAQSFIQKQEQKVVSFEQLLGGSTEFGGIKTEKVTSTTSTAEWPKLSEPVKFTVQIVCDQSPEEIRRANAAITFAKDATKRKEFEQVKSKLQQELESRQMQFEAIKMEIGKIKEKLWANEDELSKLNHVKEKTSDPKNFLFDFFTGTNSSISTSAFA